MNKNKRLYFLDIKNKINIQLYSLKNYTGYLMNLKFHIL